MFHVARCMLRIAYCVHSRTHRLHVCISHVARRTRARRVRRGVQDARMEVATRPACVLQVARMLHGWCAHVYLAEVGRVRVRVRICALCATASARAACARRTIDTLARRMRAAYAQRGCNVVSTWLQCRCSVCAACGRIGYIPARHGYARGSAACATTYA